MHETTIRLVVLRARKEGGKEGRTQRERRTKRMKGTKQARKYGTVKEGEKEGAGEKGRKE